MCIPYLANFAFLRRDADALVESPKVCRCWKGRSCYTPDTTDFCWENLGKSAEKPWICHDSDESIVVFHGFSACLRGVMRRFTVVYLIFKRCQEGLEQK